MSYFIRRMGIGALTATVCLTAGASISTAANATPSTSVSQVTSESAVSKQYRLDNLVQGFQLTREGRIKILVLSGEPDVSGEEGAEFYLYNPEDTSLGYFILGEDATSTTVSYWQQVMFTPPVSGTLEVRYGNPDEPSKGVIIASVAVR